MRWFLLLLWALPLVAADYKLPRDVVPVHYKLQYVFDVDPKTNFSFFGVVDIVLKVQKQTSVIVLHAQDFSIAYDNITLKSAGSRAPSVKAHDTHKEYNFVKLQLDAPLQADNYTLTIPFWGNLKPALDGVYISSFVHKQTNARENLIATQFEAIAARKGFPCFDEPMFKATFQIIIGHQRDYSAVSNMPLASRSGENSLEPYWPWTHIEKTIKKPKAKFTWDQFQTSLSMSTYLLAFVVSKFADVVSPKGLSTTKFAIWARSDATDQMKYASITGPKVLSYFEKFFNVSFPLPKQDMFAIPDFSAGAMENWGLITYRETSLLYDPEESSILNKERIAEVISHELAHQWFGNLVTMQWWSELWLNEGFATFMAAIGMNAVEPQWDATLGYNLNNILRVLDLDALESSHPVSVPIDDPKRISEIFDEISYKKGSSIIRMMTMFLGEEVFRKAMNNYLIKYSYKNAEQDDLWRELTAASKDHRALPPHVTVKDIMDTWTKQTGYPILNAVRDYKKGTVSISQSRFFSLKNINSTASWWISLTMLGRNQQQQTRQWISNAQGVRDQPHEIDVKVQAEDWLLFNPDMSTPMRINYDADNWLMLSKALTPSCSTPSLPVAARVQLLSDAYALAAVDLMDYELTLRITNSLQHEKEYLPLYTGLQRLRKIEELLKRHYSYGAYQKYVRRLIGETYHTVGGLATKSIENENDLNSVKMQELVSSWACRMQVPGCEDNAIELYHRWMESSTPDEDNPIPRELRHTVYCVAVARGGVAEWRWAVTRRAASNVAAVRDSLLRALACSRDTWLLSTLLDWSITEGSEIRQQDASFVISSVAFSPAGYYLARDFVYQRIDEIDKALSGQKRRLGSIVSAILSEFTVQKELDEFLVWFENHKEYFEASKLAVQQGIEKAKVNIAWMKKHSKRVVEIMREFSK